MKENKYDDENFFQKYSEMYRSVHGLDGAGEWQALRALLPQFQGKRVLDLGCGYGWHCKSVDNYYYEGARKAVFLGETVTKYHRTLTTYLGELLDNAFVIQRVVEPAPPEDMRNLPGMKDEMRRPMMLLISAQKPFSRA